MDKLTKAKIALTLDPKTVFFSALLAQISLQESDCKTILVNGDEIFYNKEFVDSLSTSELKVVLAHELLHITGLHSLRMGYRDPDKWNAACDYVVNNELLNAGFDLPKDALIDHKFSNLTVEQVYTMLPDGKKSPNGNDVISNPKQCQGENKIKIQRATNHAKKFGTVSESLSRYVKDGSSPLIDWRAEMNRFIAVLSKEDHNWSRPSMRYIHLGLYLPVIESRKIEHLVVIIDTSGSIDDYVLQESTNELKFIKNYCDTITVIYVDSKVCHVETFEDKLNPKGGGGTNFKPGFKYIDQNNLEPSGVIYITDGDCNLFPEDPGYPVLWTINCRRNFDPPFGETIYFS